LGYRLIVGGIITFFQLPLSGSQRFNDPLTLEELTELSTPSFGITEPDSGIFRLSAAFCAAPLRTNDFYDHYLEISSRPFIRAL
jgi:hypothetical protein